ncbi:MAG: DNA primase family protein [Candidatus Heimdallarchaeaceae archaeon]
MKKTINDILHEIAESLIRKYIFKTISGKKNDDIYIYINGVYEDWGRDAIRVEVEKRLKAGCKTHYVNEVINKIARKTLIEREKMGCKDVNLICLENGVLDLKNMKLMPHNPDYRFMSKIPVFYKPEAKYGKIEQFMEEVLYGEDVKVMQEWFGYNIYRRYPIKKAVILRGPTDSGKTQILNILKQFIGKDNISGKSLHKIAEGKWQIVKLYNKNSNICDELSSKDVNDVETFKAITGGSPVDAEYKFGDSFQFVNYAKLTFAANKIPFVDVDAEDDAYFNRWIIFDCENTFEKGSPNTKLEIWRELTTKKELSGILNWAIIGLKRLLKNGKFSYEKTTEEIKLIMLKENSVFSFVNECCDCVMGEWISKKELHKEYMDYCKLNNKGAVPIKSFGKELKKECMYIVEGRDRTGKVEGWRNIKIVKRPVMGI